MGGVGNKGEREGPQAARHKVGHKGSVQGNRATKEVAKGKQRGMGMFSHKGRQAGTRQGKSAKGELCGGKGVKARPRGKGWAGGRGNLG